MLVRGADHQPTFDAEPAPCEFMASRGLAALAGFGDAVGATRRRLSRTEAEIPHSAPGRADPATDRQTLRVSPVVTSTICALRVTRHTTVSFAHAEPPSHRDLTIEAQGRPPFRHFFAERSHHAQRNDIAPRHSSPMHRATDRHHKGTPEAAGEVHAVKEIGT
jgi:hypothetical protein